MFFFEKALNFMQISEMQQKIQKMSFVSEIMALWNCCGKFCILLPEHLSSAVNALANSLKISYQTEGDFFQLNFPQIDEKRG